MRKKRTYYTADEKVNIIRKHLLEKVPISDLCEQHKLQPTVFYRWQKQFFEHGSRTIDGVEKIKVSSQEEKILALEQKLQTKNEVLSELMKEHLKLKNNFGEVCVVNGLSPISETKLLISSHYGLKRQRLKLCVWQIGLE